MNLEEAIKHCDEIINSSECQKCIDEHTELKKWLEELKFRRFEVSCLEERLDDREKMIRLIIADICDYILYMDFYNEVIIRDANTNMTRKEFDELIDKYGYDIVLDDYYSGRLYNDDYSW